MFKRSKDGTQQNMFSSIPSMLTGSSYEQYRDNSAWHNLFRTQMVERVDELIFKPLYDETMGAPNSSARVLVGMLALKEGFGWSDNELFEQCRFNLLVRSALGLFNINDSLPAQSTYYLFRKRIHDYQKKNNVDIIELAFQQITMGQALDYQISGRSIRMDSKLIGSNIAWCSRYELIHDTLGLFYREMDKTSPPRLSRDDLTLLTEVSSTTGNKVVYRSTREEIQNHLTRLGILCYKVLSVYEEKDNKYYSTLKRLFDEHFHIEENGKVALIPKEDISSGTLQSAFDTDCSYRDKDGLKVKGYSVNVTETCDEGSLNLITDIQVAKANKPDTEFMKPAVEQSAMVLGHNPENIHADGAYQSPSNVDYCRQENIDHYFTGLQGATGRYDLELCDEQLTVTDTHTGEVIPTRKCKSGKWGIKTENGYRYFSKQEIDTCRLRKEIHQMPIEKSIKRNNVEATIFQLSYYTRNNKTRYRGLIQHKMWALLRCIWINLRRIMAYVEQICQRTGFSGQDRPKKTFFYQKIDLKNRFVPIFNLCQTFLRILDYFKLKLVFKQLYFL